MIEKPQASNSTVIGLSRVRARTEIRFLINDGEIRMLLSNREVEEVGMEEELVWVMGREEPLPTMIRIEEELGEREERLPEP